MNILTLLNKGSEKLKIKNIFSHRLDSEILLSNILKKRREELLINLDKKVSFNNIRQFKKIISRRSLNEPIAYILKNKEFWSKNFIVNRNVLIPRPETELMVEKIIKIYEKKDIFILDIGTGTGCILLSILSELKKSRGVGIDISSQAVNIAKKNLNILNLPNNIKFKVKSLNDIYNYRFDLIVSNPPYIMTKDIKNLEEDIKKFEPKLALIGGDDGLKFYREYSNTLQNLMNKKGYFVCEIGINQRQDCEEIFQNSGLHLTNTVHDLQGIERILSFSKI